MLKKLTVELLKVIGLHMQNHNNYLSDLSCFCSCTCRITTIISQTWHAFVAAHTESQQLFLILVMLLQLHIQNHNNYFSYLSCFCSCTCSITTIICQTCHAFVAAHTESQQLFVRLVMLFLAAHTDAFVAAHTESQQLFVRLVMLLQLHMQNHNNYLSDLTNHAFVAAHTESQQLFVRLVMLFSCTYRITTIISQTCHAFVAAHTESQQLFLILVMLLQLHMQHHNNYLSDLSCFCSCTYRITTIICQTCHVFLAAHTDAFVAAHTESQQLFVRLVMLLQLHMQNHNNYLSDLSCFCSCTYRITTIICQTCHAFQLHIQNHNNYLSDLSCFCSCTYRIATIICQTCHAFVAAHTELQQLFVRLVMLLQLHIQNYNNYFSYLSCFCGCTYRITTIICQTCHAFVAAHTESQQLFVRLVMLLQLHIQMLLQLHIQNHNNYFSDLSCFCSCTCRITTIICQTCHAFVAAHTESQQLFVRLVMLLQLHIQNHNNYFSDLSCFLAAHTESQLFVRLVMLLQLHIQNYNNYLSDLSCFCSCTYRITTIISQTCHAFVAAHTESQQLFLRLVMLLQLHIQNHNNYFSDLSCFCCCTCRITTIICQTCHAFVAAHTESQQLFVRLVMLFQLHIQNHNNYF